MKMSLNDYLDGYSIFDDIHTIKAYPFLIDNIQEVENLLVLEHGRKPLFDVVNDFSMIEVADMIVRKYDERWEALIRRNDELAGNVNKRREVTESVDTTEEKLTGGSSKDSVASFDSANLVDESGKTSEGNEDTAGTKTRTYTDEEIDAKKSYDLLNVQTKDTIINEVVSDVADFLTLSIY